MPLRGSVVVVAETRLLRYRHHGNFARQIDFCTQKHWGIFSAPLCQLWLHNISQQIWRQPELGGPSDIPPCSSPCVPKSSEMISRWCCDPMTVKSAPDFFRLPNKNATEGKSLLTCLSLRLRKWLYLFAIGLSGSKCIAIRNQCFTTSLCIRPWVISINLILLPSFVLFFGRRQSVPE